MSSLKASGDLYSAPWSLPEPAHFENIAQAWVQGQLGQAFLNSTYVTAVSASLILVFAVPAAFGLRASGCRFQRCSDWRFWCR